ncbi:hypothetical protein GRK11_004324 [Salmonella enterica]|uniref:Uncharacterized protein n=1 Tax=Salmonella enterica subsp. enterica serovar Poona TaxID=436295 RepID=A0A731YGP7_SALET|nr:hypothetical protein [Salmonella enterica subsp. enterica serovar Bareilly]EDZ8085026.1 hypothetical protein [Salmonella enterica]EED9728858.1 hypothetical protein [Salmonella enterica subsp. diarizonae]HAE3297192.1 hypothetical protein [Salmonella enterica subsp. enterica serovar Cerro]HAE4775292.1 hypothetical protein [Salmonella enterica subsp. enterica serovar Poona]
MLICCLWIFSLARMECELDCQQTRPVLHCLLNKTPERPRLRQEHFCRD